MAIAIPLGARQFLSPYSLRAQRAGMGLGVRAAGRAGMLGRAFQSGGMKGAWGATEGRVLRGMGYGAAIGAGLNAGMSLIDQANTGNYSVGRTAGAALRGGAMGALGGAAFGVGDVFLGGVRGVRGAGVAAPARAAGRGIVGSGRLAMKTPTFAAAARGVGRGMRAAGSVAREAGPRMWANARRTSVLQGSGLMGTGAGRRVVDTLMNPAYQALRSTAGARGTAQNSIDRFLRWNSGTSGRGMMSGAGRMAMRPVDRTLQWNARRGM